MDRGRTVEVGLLRASTWPSRIHALVLCMRPCCWYCGLRDKRRSTDHSYHHSLIINSTCFSQTATECSQLKGCVFTIYTRCMFIPWTKMDPNENPRLLGSQNRIRPMAQPFPAGNPRAAASCSFASVPGQQRTLITMVENRVVLNSPHFKPTVDFDADRLQWSDEIIWWLSTWHYRMFRKSVVWSKRSMATASDFEEWSHKIYI